MPDSGRTKVKLRKFSSASEVTTLWRYTNLFIIRPIIIIIILNASVNINVNYGA